MTLVVDASVAALWVLPQARADSAGALRSEDALMAPSLIVSEIGSAIWKACRRGDFSKADAVAALEAALLPLTILVPMEELGVRALEISIELGHPIYDCFYLALAERERVPLVSADERLIGKAARLKGIAIKPL